VNLRSRFSRRDRICRTGRCPHGKLYAVSAYRPAVFLTALITSLLTGCGDSGLGPEAARGKQVYLSQCTSCHAADPAQPGPVGPPVKGSSRALLEAKVVRGTYPEGYRPKRPTTVMPPQPHIAGDVGALAEFLK
jgi:mono/diheme cytochrome c family protein